MVGYEIKVFEYFGSQIQAHLHANAHAHRHTQAYILVELVYCKHQLYITDPKVKYIYIITRQTQALRWRLKSTDTVRQISLSPPFQKISLTRRQGILTLTFAFPLHVIKTF